MTQNFSILRIFNIWTDRLSYFCAAKKSDMFPIKRQKSLLQVTVSSLGVLFLWIGAGLLIDSKYVFPYFSQSQWLANFIITLLFAFSYYLATKRVREMMVYAVLIAVAGECFFSLLLEMYTYRLHNVPIYVFFGHALLYIAVMYFSKSVAARNHRHRLEIVLTSFIVIYACLFLIFKNDVFGFILTGITLLILRKHPRERLFYLTMYVSIAYLEIVGTHYECWYWPPYALNLNDTFLMSANPPSGISFFYFGLDLGSLYFYKLRHRTAWMRMKNIRSMRWRISPDS